MEKQALTLNLTLDQAKAVIAIHSLISTPKGGILETFVLRFYEEVVRRFKDQDYRRLINAWDSLVLQAQLRCQDPPARAVPPALAKGTTTHAPRVNLGRMQVTSCTCGWQLPSHAADADTAFAEHLAIVLATEGSPP